MNVMETIHQLICLTAQVSPLPALDGRKESIDQSSKISRMDQMLIPSLFFFFHSLPRTFGTGLRTFVNELIDSDDGELSCMSVLWLWAGMGSAHCKVPCGLCKTCIQPKEIHQL